MSMKHNCLHPNRGRSNYPHRPGMYSHGSLANVDGLRARQERRVRETCTLDHEHDVHGLGCNGRPWPRASESVDDLAA